MFGFEVDELGTVVNLVSPFTKEKKVLLYNLQILEHVVTHLTQHPSAKLTPLHALRICLQLKVVMIAIRCLCLP
jgi:hypothetical protein